MVRKEGVVPHFFHRASAASYNNPPLHSPGSAPDSHTLDEDLSTRKNSMIYWNCYTLFLLCTTHSTKNWQQKMMQAIVKVLKDQRKRLKIVKGKGFKPNFTHCTDVFIFVDVIFCGKKVGFGHVSRFVTTHQTFSGLLRASANLHGSSLKSTFYYMQTNSNR